MNRYTTTYAAAAHAYDNAEPPDLGDVTEEEAQAEERRLKRMRRTARRGPPTWTTGDADLDARLRARWEKIYHPYTDAGQAELQARLDRQR
jgi:hypothetical protein